MLIIATQLCLVILQHGAHGRGREIPEKRIKHEDCY